VARSVNMCHSLVQFSLILLCIVVDLVDIHTVIREKKDVYDEHDPPLLNIEKWAHLKMLAMSAHKYEVPQVRRDSSLESAKHYLLDRLHCIAPGEELDRDLKTKSVALRRQEKTLNVQDINVLTELLHIDSDDDSDDEWWKKIARSE
jgi:hypothetical protein